MVALLYLPSSAAVTLPPTSHSFPSVRLSLPHPLPRPPPPTLPFSLSLSHIHVFSLHLCQSDFLSCHLRLDLPI